MTTLLDVLQTKHIGVCIFRFLPSSFRYVALVCRKFRALYEDSYAENFALTSYSNVIPEWEISRIQFVIDLGQFDDAMKNEEAETAAQIGCLPILQFVIGHNPDLQTSRLVALAIRGGHVDVVFWLAQHRTPWPFDACCLAAANGSVVMLALLCVMRCHHHVDAVTAAAENGHLSAVVWLAERGFHVNQDTFAYAAENGHMDIVQWLHRHNFIWDAETTYWAAFGGHLELLQWAVDHGCPLHLLNCHEAGIRNHHQHVVEWCRAYYETHFYLHDN